MDEKDTKELLRDLVDSASRMVDILYNKATFGSDQESEMFMPVYQSAACDKLDMAITRVLDSGMLDED